MKVVLKRVRLAFPVIWEPKAHKAGDEPACSASLIYNAKSEAANHRLVTDAIQQVANEKWKDKAEQVLKTLKAKGDVCLHSGAEKAEFAGFEGNVFVSARNKARPMVLSRKRTPLLEKDGVIYAGCYVNVSLDVWAQDNDYGKRVNAKLLAIQFVDDGESFGGGAQGSADDFDDVDGDDEADGGSDPFAEPKPKAKVATGFDDMDDDIPF